MHKAIDILHIFALYREQVRDNRRKNMKKIITIALLALLIMMPIFANGSKENTEKTYVIAANAEWPPFEYVDETGNIVGFEMDLVRAIGEKMGIKVELKNVAWDGIFAGLQTGMYDAVASGVTVTEERKETMDFASPFITLDQAILVKADGAQYKNEKELVGKTVGVQNGTTGHFAAQNAGVKNIKNFDAIPEAVLDLANGNIDAVVCDSLVANDYVLTNESYAGKLKVSGHMTNSDAESIAMCVKKGNPFINVLEEGYQKCLADGTVDALKAKYHIL